jgi:hypothetical protein
MIGLRLPRAPWSVLFLATFAGAACDGADARRSGGLDGVLPPLPEPTGDTQAAFAGAITDDRADELVSGPASSGRIGDFYLRNDRARFVIESPARVIGVVPQGGNVVDAVALGTDGEPLSQDHFGEMSAAYLAGRTCEHDTVEILRDGAAGGVAAVRARGRSAVNDYLNIRGLGIISIPDDIDPDIPDEIECATTYVLAPGSAVLEVYFTYFNAGDRQIDGPFASLNDTGGECEAFSPGRGFARSGIDTLDSLVDPSPVDYVLYQCPGVAYGVLPRHDEPGTAHASALIAGVSVLLFGADALLDLLDQESWYFRLEPDAGVTHRVAMVIGYDAASIEAEFRRALGEITAPVAGQVRFDSDAAAAGARVGVFADGDGDGEIGPEDRVVTYLDGDATGAFAGEIATGDYLLRAEVKDVAVSATTPLSLAAAGAQELELELPSPRRFDYRVVDDETGALIPAKLTVIGAHAAFPDGRLWETYDREVGIVGVVLAPHGTSVDVGDGADPQLVVPPGEYRIAATRGTEWSAASALLQAAGPDPGAELEFRLRHVAPTPGYISTEFHQHSVGSPDSPVGRYARVATFLVEGVEFFASTDHDYVTDFQPLIEDAGFARELRAIPGIEVTPFTYGHFQAFPLEYDADDPTHGAIDWARGTAGYAMIPGEIFADARGRGAAVIQVNHPRSGGDLDIMQYFDRAGLVYDYVARSVAGDPYRAPVPNDWLRLPETSLWDDGFDAVEVWNGFGMADTDADGVREITSLDLVLRDWFNFLSFGMQVTPIGNSDSHTIVRDPIGMPRTYVRVPADAPGALEDAAIVDDVLDTLGGRGDVARDVVVTNGPHIQVTAAGTDGSPIGAVVEPTVDGAITLAIHVVSAEWAQLDTLELFVNATPDTTDDDVTALQPALCLTTRPLAELADTDPCAIAPIAPRALEVRDVDLGGGFHRFEIDAEVELAAADVALVNRDGARGGDAWVVVRVRGTRPIFPVMVNAVDEDNLDAIVTGDAEALEAALAGRGIPAAAFTAPIYVDFDGGGYSAPFAP